MKLEPSPQKISKAFLWSTVNTGFSQALGFIVGLIFARQLGPNVFGLFASVNIFIALSHLIVDCGLGQALIQNPRSNQIDYSSAFYFNFFLSLILYAILFFGAPMIARFYNQDIITVIIRIVGLTTIFQSLIINQQVIISKTLNFKLKAKISVSASIIAGFLSLWMVFNNFGIWAFICQIVLSPLLISIWLWLLVKWRPSLEFSLSSLQSMLNFGYKLLIAGFIDLIQKNILNIVIAKFFSIRELGYLNRAEALQKAPTQTFSKILSRVIFPLFSNVSDDLKRKLIGFQKTVRYVSVIIFPLILFLVFFSESIILVLLGSKWLTSAEYLSLLGISALFYPIETIYQSFIKSEGDSKQILKFEIYKLFMMIPVVGVGILYGIKFFIYGIITKALITHCFYMYFLKTSFNVTTITQLKLVGIPFIFSFATIYLTSIGVEIYLHAPLAKIFLGVLVGFSIYAIVNKIFNVSDYKELKNLIFN